MSEIDLHAKVVCGTCVSNPFLSQKINASDIDDIVCAYCGREASTLELSEIAELFNNEFQENYQVADNALRDDRGYPSIGDELHEIIQQEVSPAYTELVDELAKVVRTIWEQNSFNGQIPDTDTLFEKIGVADYWLHLRWNEMQNSLRTRTRFVNPEALEVLQMVFDNVDKDVTASGEPLIVEVGPGHALETIFRARVFQNIDVLREALQDPEAELGTHRPGYGSAGRMNARGISMFYGANSPDVAIGEVRPPVGSHVAVAKFKVLRPIRLLDLTRLPQIPPMLSRRMFDTSSLQGARRQKFLSRLGSVLTRPVMPDNSDDGYLLTQVISDYLATHSRLNLDGLIFRSVQASVIEGQRPLNVTLFAKASLVKKVLKKSGRVLNATLFTTEDDGHEWFNPQIWYREVSAQPEDHWSTSDDEAPTLELDPRSIVIYEIEGVSYTKSDSPVEWTDTSESENKLKG